MEGLWEGVIRTHTFTNISTEKVSVTLVAVVSAL